MATQLSQTTKLLRKFFLIFVIFIVVVYIIDFIVNNISNPPKPIDPGGGSDTSDTYPQATNLFGSIPKPKLQSLQLNPDTKAKFSKDKIKFNSMPTTIFVYKFKPFREQLEDAIKARTIAKTLGLNSFENYQKDNVLYWETASKDKLFEFDKINKVLNYSNNTPHPGIYVNQSSEDQYVKTARNFFNELGLNNYLFGDAEYKVYFIKKDGSNNLFTCSPEENCPYVKVNLFKQTTLVQLTTGGSAPRKAPIYRYNPLQGVVQMILTKAKSEKNDIKKDLRELKYKEFSYESLYGIYGIIDQEKAFDKLQNNEGKLVWCKLKTDDIFNTYKPLNIREFKVSIDKMRIIYIEPDDLTDEEWTHYLQPFYLIEGIAYTIDNEEADFQYLIPALSTYMD